MLILRKKPWQIVSEREVAPEDVYVDRRRLLQAAGILGVGAAIGSIACGNAPAPAGKARPAEKVSIDPPPPDIARLYPARRNPAFALDRPISDEKIVAAYNNYYEFGASKDDPSREAKNLTTRPWEIEIAGMVEKPLKIDRDELVRRLGLEERLYRHRCVEAWSIAVPWTGFPLKKILDLARPLSSARFVRIHSFQRPAEASGQRLQVWYTWPYFEGLRIEEAMNDLAFATVGMYGHELQKQNGAPFGLRLPWKYGYKSPKGVVKLELTDEQPATFWNSQQPLEYGFLSNVNPEVPHPRWSQKEEKFFAPGGIEMRPTLPYNGYADLVAGMYDDASRKTLS